MLKKTAAAIGIATAGLLMAAAPASATTSPTSIEPPTQYFKLFDDACVAPWHWNGPLNILSPAAPHHGCTSGGTR